MRHAVPKKKGKRVSNPQGVDSGAFWFLADHFSILRLIQRPYNETVTYTRKDARSWQDIGIKRLFRGWKELQIKNIPHTKRPCNATVYAKEKNYFKEILVKFDDDKHSYWIPEIIAKNIQRPEEKEKREPEILDKKKFTPLNLDALGDCLDNLDGLWENTTNKKSGTRSTGGVPPHWMEIPIIRDCLEEASEEDQQMITSGTRLSPLSLLIGGYYLNKSQSQPYSHMPYINHGYRSESKSYFFSCISCCIIPPSNKSLTIWLSFSILFLHFVQSCILIDKHIKMRDSLLFLSFLQLFFGFIHFYSTAMFHVASNVILDSMLWWWKWFLISEIFWIASAYSFTILNLGFCDSFDSSVVFAVLLWTLAFLTLIPACTTQYIITTDVDKHSVPFLTFPNRATLWIIFGSLIICTICFVAFFLVIDPSEDYLFDGVMMFTPSIFGFIFITLRIPEKLFESSFLCNYVITSVNIWSILRFISVFYFFSLNMNYLEDWSKDDYKC